MGQRERQREIDDEARRVADASMAEIPSQVDEAVVGPDEESPEARAALSSLAAAHPAAASLPSRDYSPDMEPSPAAPPPPESQELPTRDHLGNEDPSSGSVFGPDDPSETVSGPIEPRSAPPSLPATTPAAPAPPAIQPMAPSPPPDTSGVRERLAPPPASPQASPAAPPLPGAPAAQPPPQDASAIVRARLGPASALANPVGPAQQPNAPVAKPAEGGVPTEGQPRLDEGLPSEEEIASHRDNPLMAIIHGFQNGLLGAIGRPRRDFEGQADQLAQERRSGLREALQRKGVMRGQESQQAATSARQTTQDALAERRVAALEESTPARVAQMQAQTEQTRAQTEHTQLTTEELRGNVQFNAATREQREDPASAASVGMRRAVEARLALMGPSGDQEREVLGDLGQYNANQLHDVLPSLMQGVGLRVRGAGGTQAPRLPGGSLAEQYVTHGISESLPEAQALIQSLGGESSSRAQQRLATRLDEETPPPPTGSVQANIAAAQGAADEIQQLIGRSGEDIPGVGRLDAMVPTMALSEEGRRMRALILNLSDNYLRMVSGAAIPAHEIESFADRLGSSDEPIFREQVGRIQREIARRQTGSAASPATASHRRPATQAPTPESAPSAPSDDFSSMSDEELQAIAAGGG